MKRDVDYLLDSLKFHLYEADEVSFESVYYIVSVLEQLAKDIRQLELWKD